MQQLRQLGNIRRDPPRLGHGTSNQGFVSKTQDFIDRTSNSTTLVLEYVCSYSVIR
jgi:hypothetical protein